MNSIVRQYSQAVITAASSAATTSGMFPFGPFAGGCVLIGNTNGCTQIDWYVTNDPATTPVQLYADDAAVTTAVTVGAINLPDAVYPAPYLVPVVTGGTTCAMTVLLKG